MTRRGGKTSPQLDKKDPMLTKWALPNAKTTRAGTGAGGHINSFGSDGNRVPKKRDRHERRPRTTNSSRRR